MPTTPPPHACELECHTQVHFEDSCVVIPDPVAQSRMPRLVKKSYSLPLWRRRSSSQQPSSDAEVEVPVASSSPKDTGVTITVAIPSFAHARSPTRGEQHHQPLVPCLVDANHPRRFARRPSLPPPPRPDAVIVPLRSCCEECYPITEESLREGNEWQEKFTRGARRRRNSSADTHAHAHARRHRTLRDDLPGFGAIVSVDEIDRRHGISRTAVTPVAPTRDDSDEETLAPSLSRIEIRGIRPSAIGEENEDSVLQTPNAIESHLPRISSSETSPVVSAALAEAYVLAPHLETQTPEPEDKMEPMPQRETVYYTPDSSPMLTSSDEPSPLTDNGFSGPDTPKTPPPSIPVPISSSAPDHRPWFSDFTLSSFDMLHDSGHKHYHSSSHYDAHSTSTASPEMTDYMPTLPSTSPRKKNILQNLPSPGSLLRVGSDMFRGLSVPGTTMGSFA